MTPATALPQIRPPEPADAAPLADLLNAIIATGGTTAFETPFSADGFRRYFLEGPDVLLCRVAVWAGRPIGFQTLSRHPDLPAGWADTATFTRRDDPVPGAGRALFAASAPAARQQGLTALNATIRADNTGGLAFYRRLGFVAYDRSPAVPLADGRPVDRLHHRFDLGAAPIATAQACN